MSRLKVTEKEVEAVTALGSDSRYRYFIKRVADTETVWSLWGGNSWLFYRASDGRQFFPLWPAKEYADLCCTDFWESAESQPIKLVRLIDEFLPAMADEGVLPTIFPLQTGDAA